MRKFFRIAGITLFFIYIVVGAIKCHLLGFLLVIGSWCASYIYHENKPEERIEEESEHDSCDGCKHDLGGGHCKINLEGECREGGGYEAWEPKLNPPTGSDAPDA